MNRNKKNQAKNKNIIKKRSAGSKHMSVDAGLDKNVIPEVFIKKTRKVNTFLNKHGLPA
ncbi:MAG: hypothetical protein ACOZCO_06330 [Bacteroidota bacterium]